MDDRLTKQIPDLTPEQRKAVAWMDAAMLVLAGPGTGKTRVLTHRVAHLLRKSQHEGYHILALTFTNRAAAEMADRIRDIAPEEASRAFVGTFHSFCAKVLRTHGPHLGIRSTFEIVSRPDDQIAILKEALARGTSPLTQYRSSKLLKLIDCLKSRLVGPNQAEAFLARENGLSPSTAAMAAEGYKLYDQELRRYQILDFNSIIFEAYRLFDRSPFVQHYQRIYPYWLVDEFQDTNHAQYALLKRLAGAEFRNIFAVADVDQTIFEWNGAWVQRLRQFKTDFSSGEMHLTKNFRCPPAVIRASHRLLRYNSERGPKQHPSAAGNHQPRQTRFEQLQIRRFSTEQEENRTTASQIQALTPESRQETAVIARARWLLVQLKEELDTLNVPAFMVRRMEFEDVPELRWLIACLRQVRRPLDQLNMKALVDAYNRFMNAKIDFDRVRLHSESEQITLLSAWIGIAEDAYTGASDRDLVAAVRQINQGDAAWMQRIQDITRIIEDRAPQGRDLKDELKAWRLFLAQTDHERSSTMIDHFLEELKDVLRVQKAPPGTLQLMTIHGAKGSEFKRVYLIGMAEGILPSQYSLRDPATLLEEERRACYVAMTRASRQLIVSYARRYRGRPKKPSRFLREMGAPAPQ